MTTWFAPDEPPPSADPPPVDPLCAAAVVVAALVVVVAEFVVPTLATEADFEPPHADVSSARAASALRVDKQYGLDPGIASIEARLSETTLKPLETMVPRRRRRLIWSNLRLQTAARCDGPPGPEPHRWPGRLR
jgi:hypothetical protein